MITVEFCAGDGCSKRLPIPSFDVMFTAVDEALANDPDKRRGHQAEVICLTIEKVTNHRVTCFPEPDVHDTLRFKLWAE